MDLRWTSDFQIPPQISIPPIVVAAHQLFHVYIEKALRHNAF